MVGGQCLDLEADKLGLPPAPDLAHVQRLQAMKTAALIRYACEAGAILGRARPAHRQGLVRYGDRLGTAFQIADDLLDLEGDAAAIGKATRKDAGKATLVSVLGVAAARQHLADLEADALDALDPFGAKADGLRAAAAFVVRRRS
jgi:farnesyl diphosphate synthase